PPDGPSVVWPSGGHFGPLNWPRMGTGTWACQGGFGRTSDRPGDGDGPGDRPSPSLSARPPPCGRGGGLGRPSPRHGATVAGSAPAPVVPESCRGRGHAAAGVLQADGLREFFQSHRPFLLFGFFTSHVVPPPSRPAQDGLLVGGGDGLVVPAPH